MGGHKGRPYAGYGLRATGYGAVGAALVAAQPDLRRTKEQIER